MFPISDNQEKPHIPIVTWTIIGLNVLLFLWDRHLNPFGQSVVFADLTMRPEEIWQMLRGKGDPFSSVTLLTSMFLHGSLMHIFFNMLFLSVFGPGVEEALGPVRYGLGYLAWGILAGLTHAGIAMNSMVPTLGASGAIGGVLGAYFLLFPGNAIEVVVPILAFFTFEVRAWILLGLWFLYQFVPQDGVATWAHLGGFLAGMVTVLVLGGRKAIIGRRHLVEDDLWHPVTDS